ncbi:MAG: NAD(P)/FAD-dependent oxidoreductase [Acidobacteriota bacterium]|nr:NAD(P)/FAD-dependent oxidoreductase [Acidobacteriota bacterium]
MTRVVVIGAGPSGLTAAYELTKAGVPVTVLERDPERVGGLARTERYKDFLFDIGGHRFFSKSREIEDLWTEILGEDMLVRDRLSRIFYKGKFFDYPLRAWNVFVNLGPINVARALASYVSARLHPIPDARSFEDWTINAFGRRLYETFFKSYTEKVWGIPCSEISADWAAQRIKGLSMMSLLKATLLPKRKGPRERVIKTLLDQFRYPVRGPGQMWEAVTARVRERGGEIVLDAAVDRAERGPAGLERIVARTASGTRSESGTHFLSSMPIRDLVAALVPPAPPEVVSAANGLKYRDFLTVALIVEQENVFPDNWIYIHDPSVSFGRIQNFKNWSLGMVPDPSLTCLGLEYFCSDGDELWQRSDMELRELARTELGQIGLVDPSKVRDGCVVRMRKAYPVYDDSYRENVETVRRFLEAELPNLQLIGRNGMHKYNNQDHAMMTGLLASRNILGGTFDVWKVNSDAEYQENGDVQDSARALPKLLTLRPGGPVIPEKTRRRRGRRRRPDQGDGGTDTADPRGLSR